MGSIIDSLEKYRDLAIGKSELESMIRGQTAFVSSEELVVVRGCHVIKLLRHYQNHEIDENKVLEWVNTIWFSGWFDYSDEENDSIASVMNELEELDEPGKIQTPEKVKMYIRALEENVEV
ncbi:MAG: hypothetical protein ACM3MK_08680 [Chitinophagales bacterium]